MKEGGNLMPDRRKERLKGVEELEAGIALNCIGIYLVLSDKKLS